MSTSGASTVVLVTGAASGLGRHVVGRLLSRGDAVFATDVDVAKLDEVATSEGWTHTGRLDVAEAESWTTAFERTEAVLGPVEVLIHVAGVIEPCTVKALRDRDIAWQVQVNLVGPMLGVRAAIRRMVPRGRGHIVLVNSLTGIAPSPGMTVYSATKFGARGFALGAAQELVGTGVDLTVIYPDGMDTPMGRYEATFEEAALTFSASRLLSVDEVGDALIRALERRPLEVLVPRGRGLLSRLAGLFPAAASRLTPRLVRRGRANQQRAAST